MKCSFCEETLACAACKQPVTPRSGEAYAAVYQPDMEVLCPECQEVLVCRSCGFVYGEQPEEEEATPGAP
jgi:hypothetical protein